MTEQYLSALKEHKSWVCWTYEERDGDQTKPPIAPFDGNRYASSSDPNTWRTYEEAVEYHDRDDTDTEGVWYMLDEGTTVAGVDLDGCRDPTTGKVESWAEDIIETLDSYTEVSPSGTGFRVFLHGFKPDGRNRRKQERTLEGLEDLDKEAEVELYDSSDNRYLTFTGDHLEGTPTRAKQRHNELGEVYEEYVADTDANDDNSSSRNRSDVDLSNTDGGPSGKFKNEFGTPLKQIREWDEKLDDLLNALEPAGYSYPSASEADLAAASKLWFWRFSDSDIGSILRKYRDREKLERDDYLELTIAKAKGGERCDPPRSRNVTGETESSEAKKILTAILEWFEDESDRELRKSHRRRIWNAVSKLPGDDDLDELLERTARLLETSKYAVENHRENAVHKEEYGPIRVKNGATWYIHGEPLRAEKILNFELGVESFLQVERGPVRAQLHMDLGDEDHDLAIEPRVFNKKERFDDEILGKSWGATFSNPSSGEENVYTQDVLDAIKLWIDRQDAPTRIGTRHIGVHGDELVVPGGVLTVDGWIDDPKHVYLEREIGVERRVAIPTDRSTYNRDDVKEILEKLHKTREIERFLPVLAWFYTTPFRSHIDDWNSGGGMESEFNHLNVTGGTGSGKTTTLSYLWRCFGMAGQPFSVDSSQYAQLATFASTKSLPIWFDEYRPGDIANYKLDKFHDLYRKASRGAYAERGNADKSTDSYKIQAPVVLSGEQAIQGPAERRRTIMTQFKSDTTDVGTETAKAFKELVGSAEMDNGELKIPDTAPDPMDHALAYYRYVCGADTEKLREEWHESLEKVYELLGAETVGKLDDPEPQGLQIVAFGWRRFREFALKHDVEPSALPTESDLKAALEFVVSRIGVEGKRKSHEDLFLELFERAAVQGYVERGQHYEIVREGQQNEEIRINLPRCHDQISKYAKDHDVDSADLLNSASDYRDRFEEKRDDALSYVECVRQPTPPVSKCVGISTVGVIDELGFDRHALEVEKQLDTGKTGAKGGSGDDDPDESGTELDYSDDDQPAPYGATSIADIEAEGTTGYVTVTAEVATWSANPDEVIAKGGPCESGTLVDETGPIDVVDFEGCNYTAGPLESGMTVLVENAKVDEYNGTLQLVFVQNVTEVREITAGVGYAPEKDDGNKTLETAATDGGAKAATPNESDENAARADAGDSGRQTPDEEENDESGDESAETDDDKLGTRPEAEKLVRVLNDAGRPLKKVELFAKAADMFDQDPHVSADALEFATENGMITELASGKFDT